MWSIPDRSREIAPEFNDSFRGCHGGFTADCQDCRFGDRKSLLWKSRASVAGEGGDFYLVASRAPL